MRRAFADLVLGRLLVLLAALALGGCGVGSGDSDPEGATLAVTATSAARVLLEKRAERSPAARR